MSQNHEMPVEPQASPSVTTCGNCQSPMPYGLRFCRNCGYRLGEGPAEYTETVRFKDRATSPETPSASQYATTYGVGAMAPSTGGSIAKRAKKMSGMTWMFIGLLIFFLAAAVFTAVVAPIRRSIAPAVTINMAPRAHFGVEGFKTVDGVGVTFDEVAPPDGPADKAGLVGGDIMTTFDGKEVRTTDEVIDLLRAMPMGKTVDVVYIRDGETKTTKLTPVSNDEIRRLERVFRDRPERPGRFGYDDGNTERVAIEGTKMFGVRLDSISPNMPADMAGIKEGDVVIEFDNTPIRTGDELRWRVRRAIPYSTVKVVVMRGAERLEFMVKMGRQ